LSIGGQLSFADFGAYSASEFALEGIFEKHWLRRPPRFGIKLLLVKPGNFRTNLPGSGTHEMLASDAFRQRVGRGAATPPSWSPKKAHSPGVSSNPTTRNLLDEAPLLLYCDPEFDRQFAIALS
jgi:hypothetical protein